MRTKVIRLRRWKIDVYGESLEQSPIMYTVIAVDELDARIIAFCLDGGFRAYTVKMQSGHIELVKAYTKILEVSSA